MYNIVKIEYCPKCRWLLRAAWMQQELLTTFEDEINEFCLIPSKEAGKFDIWVNSNLIFSRKEKRGFPELKELKNKLKDIIAPNKNLGHSSI